jgi:ABC-type transporter Mla subunit MlaD
MVNVKEENKVQSNNIKEETKEFLDHQRQQLANTTSTISETSNSTNNNINEYQQTNRAILEKSIELADKYQQQIINTIKAISNNYVEAQKNFLYNYQPAFSKFIDDTYTKTKSNWNNFFRFPESYAGIYNKTNNKNSTDHIINCTQRVNDVALASTETLNKSIEIAQKYYNESVQNYFNFVNKIEKSYYNH